MIVEQQTLENGGVIALWHITEDRDQLLETLELDPFILEQTFAFSSAKRQLEYLAVRNLYKAIMGEQPNIHYKENRAPYLDEGKGEISITHTGSYAAIYLHPTAKVGIDIERITDKVVRVKNRFLSDEELSFVDPRNEKTHLTILWAAKEALYKLAQIDNLEFKTEIHIAPFTPYLEGTIESTITRNKLKHNYQVYYKVFPEFVMTWVMA